MVAIAFIPVFGKPLILYIGVITFASFLITAIFGISYYRGLLKFKWHPTMIVVSFFLAIVMAIVGVSAGNPPVGILGLFTLLLFSTAAIIGLSIHKRKLDIRFMWHPAVVSVAFIFATIHGILGIIAFGGL